MIFNGLIMCKFEIIIYGFGIGYEFVILGFWFCLFLLSLYKILQRFSISFFWVSGGVFRFDFLQRLGYMRRQRGGFVLCLVVRKGDRGEIGFFLILILFCNFQGFIFRKFFFLREFFQIFVFFNFVKFFFFRVDLN